MVPNAQPQLHDGDGRRAADDDRPRGPRRRVLLALAAAAAMSTPAAPHLLPAGGGLGAAQAAAPQLQWRKEPRFLAAFQEALAAQGGFEERDEAWGRAIALGPDNAAAWSNRGTLRLQHQRWQAALDDLSEAAALEEAQAGAPSALVLNNLGNVEGALGRWDEAMAHYQAAADDAELGSIAAVNFALAAFETRQDALAVRAARTLLRRDPGFMDVRAALTAFLWGSGRRAEAEGAWEELQQASDGLGAAMYSRAGAVERVRHRWPPRATAALGAFLALSERGQAEGYDLAQHEYVFPAAPGPGPEPAAAGA